MPCRPASRAWIWRRRAPIFQRNLSTNHWGGNGMKRSIPTASTWIEKTGRAGILLVRLRQAGILLPLLLAACAVAPPGPEYDLVIRGGTIYDGSGGPPFRGDVAIEGDRIAWVGAQAPGTGAKEIDARGLAVAPGFI